MHRLNSQWIIHALTVIALLLPGAVVGAQGAPPAAQPRSTHQAPLSLEARAAYQRAIEEVYWRHRIWPKENPGPKPPLDAVLSPAQLQAKVEDALRLSNALEKVWGRPVTGEQLQAEIERMARNSQQPEVLRELWQALGNDPYVIAEVLARPILVERLARNWYAQDGRFQAQSQPFEDWWQTAKDGLEAAINEPTVAYTLPQITASAPTAESWTPTHALPEANLSVTGVWTGSEMIIWGGTETGGGKFNSGSRYNPATDTWRTTAMVGAPMGRKQHSAVWTGTEMIVWGGCGAQLDEHNCQTDTGGRYNPATETWTPTSTVNTPGSRMDHTAVWTGSEMIIWGGCSFFNNVCRVSPVGSTGGRYNPATDTWQATSTVNAPGGRTHHTAVWTNSEMIVWGGADDSSSLSTGGRYNPVTDTWQPTASISSGFARYDHTALWSGRDMIVWGGTNGTNTFNNGARYNPATNRWRLISSINAPSARSAHTAVWTGTEMIVWGGWIGTTLLNTGGRYNPRTNTWTPTSTVNAPPGRAGFVSVWTGTEMIIWGGGSWQGGRYAPASDTWTLTNANEATSAREGHTATWTGVEMVVWGGDDRFNGTVNTGGRYTLATDSWQPTPTTGAPGPRNQHTAIWTGTEVIIWGGGYGSTYKTGGRYNPTANTWTATSTVGAPEARANHSAIWTGTEMIVWGGDGPSSPWLNTGGRYNPATDTWTATSTTGAPSPRYLHAAVWTGSEMIIWGGATATYDTNTGGRYNPATDTWAATSTVNAPSARAFTAAVWTGSAMLIWGGQSYIRGIFNYHNTGGLYNPATDTWTATSTVNAPSPRAFFGYVWTNAELIVWGGCTQNVGGACQNDVYTGGRFDPATNTWTAATTTVGAPSARNNHTAVWTGSQMIVWGGFDEANYTYTFTGGIYVPGTP